MKNVIVCSGLVLILILFSSLTSAIAQHSDIALSPLKQIKLGVLPQNVQCKEGFVLVWLPQDAKSACVLPTTAEKLLIRGWVDMQKLETEERPPPAGYLGGYFVSSGTYYPLKQLSLNLANSSIPQSAINGNFSFLFSNNNYTQDDFSVSYQSCSGNLNADFDIPKVSMDKSKTSFTAFENIPQPPTRHLFSAQANILNQGTNKMCNTPQSLGFSYGKNSDGQYAVTTQNAIIPCGSAQISNGHLIPKNYYLVIFSVNTTGYSIPYSYTYLIYGGC